MDQSDRKASFYKGIGQAYYLYNPEEDTIEGLSPCLTELEHQILIQEPGTNRIRFCINRVVARKALREIYPFDEANTPSILTKTGEPPVFSNCIEYYVSISHSQSLWYAVSSRQPVGIDIENMHRITSKTLNAIQKHFVKPSEDLWVRGNDINYLKIWCIKEASVKLLRLGMFAFAQYLTVVPDQEHPDFFTVIDAKNHTDYTLHVEQIDHFIKAVAKKNI